MSCWYKNTCKNYKENCEPNCIRYNEMKYMIESANIPKGNQFKNELIPSPVDIENFRFLAQLKQDMINFVIRRRKFIYI